MLYKISFNNLIRSFPLLNGKKNLGCIVIHLRLTIMTTLQKYEQKNAGLRIIFRNNNKKQCKDQNKVLTWIVFLVFLVTGDLFIHIFS